MDSAVGLRIPRPIGWISTKNKKGQCNLAPYSRFNNLTFDPPYVMFSSNQTATGDRKDMVVNAEEIGTFAWNLATWDVREAERPTLIEVPMGTVDIAIGKVIGVHIGNEVLTNGSLDIKKTQPITRCGYYQYAVTRDTFEMIVPNMSADVLYGLEGNATRNHKKNEENEKEKNANK
ncbi:flavin reductase family protein [Aspergillus alliaceus]|uniref:flavin reductase family protein n=1 Tax=Petromyces alliaceus TaxID=209559 RepID=UPI0012A5C167|nr:uncharacterized protein BDW43DRAFT_308357 [Aspergillus alliaceus]KAB8236679.1 hypothetical protein BDW43DRAFT_308357 [Aspergillus alliaceus]